MTRAPIAARLLFAADKPKEYAMVPGIALVEKQGRRTINIED